MNLDRHDASFLFWTVFHTRSRENYRRLTVSFKNQIQSVRHFGQSYMYVHLSASHTETRDVSVATHCTHCSLTSWRLWSRTDSAGKISLKYFNISSLFSLKAYVADNIYSFYSEWIEHAPPESVLRVLICLRLLIRDPHHQVQLKKPLFFWCLLCIVWIFLQ